MPVYSLSRTKKYTTEAQIETLANQTNFDFDGYPQHGYASSFPTDVSGNTNTICPDANRLWDYTNPASPVAHYTWYPYSMTLAICGGGVYYNDTGTGGVSYRPGYAYLKLYTSGGTFLMGSTNYNLSVHNPNTTIIINGSGVGSGQTWNIKNSILSTTKKFDNSRNTLTITGPTTYLAGAANASTGTSFWQINGGTSPEPGQNVYTDSTVTESGNMVPVLETSNESNLGFITYNNAPVQPTSVVFTTTSDGISVTYQGNEVNSLVNSLISDISGNVTQTLFFYSTTQNGTYNILGFDKSITRTLISGTTYRYTASFSGGTTLQKGQPYYFKIASLNDICIDYAKERSLTYVAGAQSIVQSTPIKYGTGGFVKVYTTAGTWVNAPINIYTSSGWQLKSSVFAKNTSTGYIYN
jgi:hypothetical protein